MCILGPKLSLTLPPKSLLCNAANPKKLHLCYSNMVVDKDQDVGPKNLGKQASILGQRPRKFEFVRLWSQKPQKTGIHSWPEAKKIKICKILVPKTSENGLPLLARGQDNLNLQRRKETFQIKMRSFSRLNRPQNL